MQRLEFSGAVRHTYMSLGGKGTAQFNLECTGTLKILNPENRGNVIGRSGEIIHQTTACHILQNCNCECI
jgi:hypothetical protein